MKVALSPATICRNLCPRRIKKGTIVDLHARRRRKAFDRPFSIGMHNAIAFAVAEVRAKAELAAKVKLPMKRRARQVSYPPRKKARITVVMVDTILSDERPLLGSYWTTVSDRRGNMISVRRSHRLSQS